MNDLRLILIGLGLLIIVFVYFSESIKNRRFIRSRIEKFSSPDAGNSFNIKIKARDDESEVADLGEFVNDVENNADISDEFRVDPDVEKNESGARDEKDKKQSGSELTVIYLIRKNNTKISLNEIRQAAETVGMIFGKQNIFHYYDSGYETDEDPVFSMANMLEPGSFEPDNPQAPGTSGLALFMQKHDYVNPIQAFELMYEAAEKLAGKLESEMFDVNRNPFDINTMYQIRDNLLV